MGDAPCDFVAILATENVSSGEERPPESGGGTEERLEVPDSKEERAEASDTLSDAVGSKPDPLENTLEEEELVEDEEVLNQSAEQELLSHSAEERELQARDMSSCSNDEAFDVDFLIMDEVRDDDDDEERASKERSASLGELSDVANTSVEKEEEMATKNDDGAEGEEEDVSMEKAPSISVSDDDVALEEPQQNQEGSEKLLQEEGTDDLAGGDTETGRGSEGLELPLAGSGDEPSRPQPSEPVAENDPSPIVQVPESAGPPDAQWEDPKLQTEEPDYRRTSSPKEKDSPVENGAEIWTTRATDAHREGTVAASSMEGADDSQQDFPRSEKGAECNGTPSSPPPPLKRALSPELPAEGGAGDAPKKIKSEVMSDVEDGEEASANKVVVMTRAELEKYVKQRVKESLAALEQNMLHPMEKKCDTLHRALERWRRRSFQLQKQLNEFVCEQEKCVGARRGRVSQRSVGVCVRMPPLKSQTSTPPTPASRPPLVARSTAPANVSAPPAKSTPSPMVRVLTLPPASSSSTVLNRLSTQQVKSVSIPVSAGGSNTVVRTVTMMPTSTSAVTTSAGVKVIDLTQEEDAGLARFVAVSSASGSIGTVQKITVPTSGIPMLSAAPTSLVQVAPVTTRNMANASMGVSAGPTSGGGIRINQSMVTPQRVTYLLPSLAPNVVVGQREGAPRLSTPPVHMPTILLRMATPPSNITTVQGSAIPVGNLATQPGNAGAPNLMVAPPGTQVRMIRAPPPVTLQKSGSTFTLPPGTTVVRAPATLPGGIVATTTEPVATPQRVVVAGADGAAAAVGKHPAPLPPMPRYLDDPEKKRLPPKPALKITKAASAPSRKRAPAQSLDQLLTEWQEYMDTGRKDGKPRVGRRPADFPLRLECSCRLGTCDYASLPAAFKENIYGNFRRCNPLLQMRILLKRMHKRTKRDGKRKAGRVGGEDDWGGRMKRCKWTYYLEAPGQQRRQVCKAAFMAVHGISEKRVREAQLQWMKQTKASAPTSRSGDETSAPEDEGDSAEKEDEETPKENSIHDEEDDLLDISALEPICSLVEEAESVVLHHSPGAFDEQECEDS